MAERRRVVDRQGRAWSVSKVAWEDAEAEDIRFWYEGLTPEERVEAVADLTGRWVCGLGGVACFVAGHR